MKKRLIFIIFFVFLVFTSANAQSSRMNTLRQQQKDAQRRVEDTSKKLKQTQLSAKKSLSQLNQIAAEVGMQRREIGKLNVEIGKIESDERVLLKNVTMLEKSLNEKKGDYAKAMRSLYRENSGYETLIFLFSANSFSQTIRRVRYLKEFSTWRKVQATAIIAQQEELEQQRKVLQSLRGDKNKVLQKRSAEAEILKSKEGKQRLVVNSLKKDENALRKELQRQRKQAAGLNRKIENLIAEEARNSNRIKSSTERKPQSTGGYSMTKDEQVLAQSFEQNRGRLPMPLSGKYIIVGHYGRQQHQELKYVQVNNSGIIIKTVPGGEARSVFNGVVTKIFVVPGYNSSVIVRHGNYLTIYSNLKEVYVKVGSRVSTKQAIGSIYSDPEDKDLTLLHFQLWRETVKQNPEIWLGK
ncbi:MAG: peptidoglycan DD-metalloendopeptidase family protein [Bacteroidales bacterium]